MSGLTDTRNRIAAACEAAGRAVDDLHLIAVSKVQPLERVEAVLEAGHRVFGENRVQEAAGKWPELRERFPGFTPKGWNFLDILADEAERDRVLDLMTRGIEP